MRNKINKSFGHRPWLCILFLLLLFRTGSEASTVDVIQIDGPVTPVTAKYITDAVKRAERDRAECLIIEMDTPGGLLQSTLTIDKELLSDRIPVIVYISPSGGRAASAGVFISYAAHLLAMAPSTNIGSAHPVGMGGSDTSRVMQEKVTNDAVAHIRGLASRRNRNAAWAEDAVRRSVSITEKEAIRLGVADLVAENLDDLLEKLDGKIVKLEEDVVLRTAGREIRRFPMSWRYRILDKISDPNIAYLLMLGGIVGLFFELQNPGAIFPGALGAICLILAFFALQVLPINAAGILLILVAGVLFVLELHITSYGLLTIGGIVSMTFGSLMLFRSPDVRVSLSVIIPAVLATAAFFFFVIGMGLRAQFRKPTTGKQGLAGEKGEVIRADKKGYSVSVHGEIWRAVSDTDLKNGDRIEVVHVEGMTIRVKPVGKD